MYFVSVGGKMYVLTDKNNLICMCAVSRLGKTNSEKIQTFPEKGSSLVVVEVA